MKICPKCNSLCEDSASFCQECGAPLPAPNDNAHTQENQKQQESQFQQNAYYQNAYQNNYNQNNYYRNGATAGIMPRNLVLAIVFSFLTCGIYSIYWMIKLNDEGESAGRRASGNKRRHGIPIFFDHLWNLWYLLGL